MTQVRSKEVLDSIKAESDVRELRRRGIEDAIQLLQKLWPQLSRGGQRAAQDYIDTYNHLS